MSDLKLNDAHDLAITNGDLSLVDGQDAIAQQLEIRLRFWFSEWFRNRAEGIDFLRYVLVKNPQEQVIVTLLSRVIRETPGITALNDITLSYDNKTRSMSVSFTCTCVTGTVLTYKDFDLTKPANVTE